MCRATLPLTSYQDLALGFLAGVGTSHESGMHKELHKGCDLAVMEGIDVSMGTYRVTPSSSVQDVARRVR